MENKLVNYNDKYKMKVFKEIVKLALSHDLEKEIDNLPKKILRDNCNDKDEEKIINSYIRLVMGLSPANENYKTLSESVRNAFNLDSIEKPLVATIQEVCERCNYYHRDGNHVWFDEGCPRRDLQCITEEENCVGCTNCIDLCPLGALSDKIEFIPVVKLLKGENTPVFATIAPAYVGQLGKGVTPGKLRSALKTIGFTDMIEVAVFADILTLKEAYEFHNMIKSEKDYFITSCCCPIWVGMIQRNYKKILDHVSPSVSPMIASGRVIKALNPEAKVVFIGPCVAKKAEAMVKELKGAIDFVLTFNELKEIFEALEIDVSKFSDETREEASFAGRVYARTGGVSEAVKATVEEIGKPKVPFKQICFDGVKDCKEGLEKLLDGKVDANFIEGMGCIGGCVGGPRIITSVEKGTEKVNEYSSRTNMKTPFDNFNVLQLLTELGIKRIEMLRHDEEENVKKLLTRNFND